MPTKNTKTKARRTAKAVGSRPLVMLPMSSAPRDGTEILIRVQFPHAEYPVAFRAAKWREKASTLHEGGGWNSVTRYESHIDLDAWCEGWLPIPLPPNNADNHSVPK